MRDVGAYARFLDVAADRSGGWVNYSKLASDLELPKETVRRFHGILEDTLLAFRSEAYRPRTSRRRVSQRDRFVLFDVGVRNTLLGAHRRPPSGTERGLLFEQWVLLQLLTLVRANRLPWRVSSFRTDTGLEVHAVIDTARRLLAVECKLGRNVRPEDLRGLRAFATLAHAPVTPIVLFGGDRRERLDAGVEAVPWRTFLLEDLPALAQAGV